MKRFLIADEFPLIRLALKYILQNAFMNAVVDEAQDAEALLQKVRDAKWDLVITDISMTGRSGFDVLQQLKQSHPSLPVLIITAHPEETFAVRAIKAGAAGYLKKDLAIDEITTAIARILSGKKYISFSLAEKLVFALSKDFSNDPHDNLSDREFEIARMVAGGMTLKGIAEKLCLGHTTVSTYRTRIMEKLHLSTNTQLTLYAIAHKII